MKYRMFYNQGKYGKLRHIKIMGGLPMDKEEVVSKNFIEKIIDQDLAEENIQKLQHVFLLNQMVIYTLVMLNQSY